MITRNLQEQIEKQFFKGKAILIIGACQTGKTTLVDTILQNRDETILRFNGDEADTNDILGKATVTKLKRLIKGYSILFFDEAQKIENIGTILKLIVDNIKEVQVIASGSSSFDLMNNLNEPLTGRKYEFHLYPLSFNELADHFGPVEEIRSLEHRLIYGSYPDIVSNPDESEELLRLLAGSYLYKDLLMLEQIKKPVLLGKILKARALQVGSEVSYNEISSLVESDKKTVEKYIDLLEKTYIIFRLPGLNRNVRNEIKKGKKIYFHDTGIRNAIIADYRPLTKRTDTGALWENYLISERLKFLRLNSSGKETYFWRTSQKQEIDYIETRYNHYSAFEFRWSPAKRAYLSKTFASAYPDHDFFTVTPENYVDFLLEE